MGQKDVLIATVIGGADEEYDFLAGTLAYHLAMGARILVWETSARPDYLSPAWPHGVTAVRRPIYGAGPEFDYAAALNDLSWWVESNTDAKILVRLDADEYLPRSFRAALDVARGGRMARVTALHHLSPWWGVYLRRHSTLRAWPTAARVRHQASGMGAFHPVPAAGAPAEVLLQDIRIQHLRFAIGRKAAEAPAYWVDKEWPHAQLQPVRDPWPAPIIRWREEARRPTAAVQEG